MSWIHVALVMVTLASGIIAGAQEIRTFDGHEGAVTMGRFSSDGRTIVSGSADATVRIWNVDTGLEIRRYTQHTGPVYCVAVSDSIVASGSQDSTIRIWDLPTLSPVATISAGAAPVHRIAVTPDGKTALLAGDHAVRLLKLPHQASNNAAEDVQQTRSFKDCQTVAWRNDGVAFAAGNVVGRVQVLNRYLSDPQLDFHAHDCAVVALAFSGVQTLITFGADGEVRIWNIGPPEAPTENSPSEPQSGKIHEQGLVSAVIDNAGTQFVTCGRDGRVVMTDSRTLKTVREFKVDQRMPTVVAMRADNQRVVAGTQQGDILVWNTGNGEQIQMLHVEGAVTAIACSRDNQHLAAVDGNGRLYVFGPSLPGQPREELVHYQTISTSGTVNDVTFSADGRSLWTGMKDGTVAEWRHASPVQVRQLNAGGAVYGVALSDDGTTLVSCGADQIVRVWEVGSGRLVHQMRGHAGAIHAVTMNREESLAVTSGADGTLRLWDLVGGRQLKQLANFNATMYAITIANDGRMVAAAGADRNIHLLDLLTGEEKRTLTGHSDFIHSLRYHPTENTILSYGYAGFLKTWNADTGDCITSQQVGRIGNDAEYSAEGTRVLLANGDGRLQLLIAPENP